MQLQLPIFPVSTKLLSPTWGVFEKDGSVFYLHNGSPVYSHDKNDLQTFRFVAASLINNNSCSSSDLQRVFSFDIRNFQRYAKIFKDKGADVFFNPQDERGKCHKMTPAIIILAQEYLDLGYSQKRTAKEINVNEASIRYHIRKGNLKKKLISNSLQSISERNNKDIQAGYELGIAATRVEERMLATVGKLAKTPVEFLYSEGVDFGGVLFLLPSLIQTGLLSYKNHYSELSGYYDLDTIILSLSFLYLCRIKNPEQLKHISPGEFGKLLGLDRIPEARNLRYKLSKIVEQKQSEGWNSELAKTWVEEEENTFFYIDGHVQVYSGSAAKLGKKHISRLKICLPGMLEFWVNNADGLPYFVVTGEVNEKMQQIILEKILPELLENVAIKVTDEELKADPDLARFTLVFDREISSPKFFAKLWEEYRVAILTYKKNVKEKWDDELFEENKIEIDANEVVMKLAEKDVELDNVKFREIRKKNSDSHQTSIITNNNKLTTILIAIKMFSRWTQENFFKYMRSDYDLDHIVHYLVNQINEDFKVVNPLHRNLTNKLKNLRNKITIKEANLYRAVEQNIKDDIDNTTKNTKKQIALKEELSLLKTTEQEYIKERKEYPYQITIKEMKEEERYNKLDIESKLFQNIIKMICYRAETSFAILLASNYKKKINEMRALTKSLINTKVNIIPDYKNEILTIELFLCLSAFSPNNSICMKQRQLIAFRIYYQNIVDLS